MCSKCGHTELPYWVEWQRQWVLWEYNNGDCPKCEDIEFGQKWMTEYRKNTLDNYGLNDGVFATMTFNTYFPDPKYPSQAAAKEAIIAVVREWKKGNWAASALLRGEDKGCGKTHLVVAAARNGTETYQPKDLTTPILIMWDMPSYVAAVKESYNNGGTEKIQREAQQAGILVLDDLGAEYVLTGKWYEDLIFTIINERWKRQRATLVTTNLPTKEELLERIGERAFSRLIGLTGAPIDIDGDDYRLRGGR